MDGMYRRSLVGLVAVTVLATLSVLARPSVEPGPEPSRPPGGPQPAFGAYLGYGSDGVRRVGQLGAWLGRTSAPRVGHVYLPGDRWSNIEGAPGYLELWARWRRARPDRLFVLNVPMLERTEAHLSDDVVRTELRRGAAGRYDGHFRTLAERLVRLGVPDTVVVLGWEMNGDTYTHRCGPDPRAWQQYWRNVVTAMRSVPGQRFRFDFTPSRGRDAVPWTDCYPGDDVVDIVGMDAYDQPGGLSFAQQVTEPYGLRDQVRFARAHGKPVSYPEWGLYRNGDNPAYMRGMLDWFARQRPLYQTISDYCPHGVWRCPGNPEASDVYRSLLGDDRAPR
ncbi:glycoside hydrolase family 26 protein [Streptomyces sp. NPDC001443]